MGHLTNTFKSLLKIAGKTLFVIGLVLNICMLCFGFWPSFIYILIMLAGAGLIVLNKDVNQEQVAETDRDWLEKGYNTIVASFKKTNKHSIEKVIKNVFISLISIIVLVISAFVLLQDYFKQRDTINNCKAIAVALDHYKESKKAYPENISELITQNPLLSKTDQWGNSFQYRTENNGANFILTSAGQDGKFNTRDDLIFKN
jgi:general secretion pathway protein G